MLNRVSRLRPVPATVVIAVMLAEEGADTGGTKISDTVLTVPRQDDRVGENDLVLVDATLEVAQNVIPARDVVTKVAKGLHDLSPSS